MISNDLLKGKIINRAIQGKLIENDKSLKPIEIYKTDEEDPFEIPSNWRWIDFKKGFELKQGTQIDLEKQSIVQNEETPLQFLRIVDFTQINSDIRYVSNVYSDYWINENDVAMVRYGTPGFVCFGKSGVLANNLFRIIPKIEIFNKYLYYLLKSDFVQDKIVSHSVALSAIKFSDIYKLIVPIPPLEEQKRIADMIDYLFELIDRKDKNDQKKAKLKEILKERITSEAIHGTLIKNDLTLKPIDLDKFISNDNAPFSIPNNWRWTKLGDITNYGKNQKKNGKSISDEEWILELEDIESGTSRIIKKITQNNRNAVSDKNIFKKGDILYGKLRPYLNKCVIVDDDGYCSTEIEVMTPIKDINAKYLKIVLMSLYFQNYVNQLTYGAKMPRLGTKDGQNALIPVPPIEEQHRIVEKLELAFEQIQFL